MSATSALLNQFGLAGLNASLFRQLEPELLALLESSSDLAGAMGDFTDKFDALVRRFGQTSALCQCAPVAPPTFEDSSHPAGSLRAGQDSVTTAGGYRIEMLGQHEWKITGPDGASTRIWGDPHVAENDGGTWDFKRNATFVLGDGTRINVTTVPFGNGMTVTGQLEIISGNDRVVVSDIDKGKGKIGTVTQDGYQHVNSFGGDVFVMGQETDDWSFQGREIIGSENGGESFKLGGELHPLTERINTFGGGFNWASTAFETLMSRWDSSWRSSDRGFNPYSDNGGARWERRGSKYERSRHVKQMREAFRALGAMFFALALWSKLNEAFAAGRNRTLQV